jgi:hypothetical protein
VEPASTRATSGEPSHPHVSLTLTRDKNPDDAPNDQARERSGLASEKNICSLLRYLTSHAPSRDTKRL